jgi:benzoylformate decarboxylase
MGFLSAAMGGLGFALPGTIGVRMALPDRPVVAVLGDGTRRCTPSRRCGAPRATASGAVPGHGQRPLRDHGQARGEHGQAGAVAGLRHDRHRRDGPRPGLQAIRIEDHADLLARLDEVLPGLALQDAPLVLEIAVEP